MEVGVARLARIVGLVGVCVGPGARPGTCKLQLIKNRAGINKAMKILYDLDWKNGCLGVMDRSSFRTLHTPFDIIAGINIYSL
jgi:hypothetical protein